MTNNPKNITKNGVAGVIDGVAEGIAPVTGLVVGVPDIVGAVTDTVVGVTREQWPQ